MEEPPILPAWSKIRTVFDRLKTGLQSHHTSDIHLSGFCVLCWPINVKADLLSKGYYQTPAYTLFQNKFWPKKAKRRKQLHLYPKEKRKYSIIYGKYSIGICNNFIQVYSRPRTFAFFLYILKEPSSTSTGVTTIVTLLAVPSDGRANVGSLLQLTLFY
jgi:hypothetical protein